MLVVRCLGCSLAYTVNGLGESAAVSRQLLGWTACFFESSPDDFSMSPEVRGEAAAPTASSALDAASALPKPTAAGTSSERHRTSAIKLGAHAYTYGIQLGYACVCARACACVGG